MTKLNKLTTPENKEFIFNIPDNVGTDRRGFYKTDSKAFREANQHIDFGYLAHDLEHRGLNADNDYYERNNIKLPSIKYSVTLVRSPLIDSPSTNWQDTAYKWVATLNGQTFEYYTGSGLVDTDKYGRVTPRKPSLEDVLYALMMDSDACTMSFSDWCDCFGYDNDSIKARKTYDSCQENADKLAKAGIHNTDDMQKYFKDF